MRYSPWVMHFDYIGDHELDGVVQCTLVCHDCGSSTNAVTSPYRYGCECGYDSYTALSYLKKYKSVQYKAYMTSKYRWIRVRKGGKHN